MIIHYIKISIRKLSKNYIFSSINIAGLVIALAIAFLIFHFVLSELTTDHFHKNKDDLYRIGFKFNEGTSEEFSMYGTTYIFADQTASKFPEIVNTARISGNPGQYIVTDMGSLRVRGFLAVDPEFFDIFTIDIINGNKNNLVNEPHSIVMSESMAQKYFPDKNPVGETLEFENQNKESKSYIITGVFKDLPKNSTIQANFIGHLGNRSSGGRMTNEVDTYIQLKKGTDQKIFQDKLNELTNDKYRDKEYYYFVQKLTDVYFHSGFLSRYTGPSGNYKIILIYSLIGIIILTIAGINYVIITTASATERLTEIGIRKVLGAQKLTITKQMVIESFMTTILAFPLAIILSEIISPTFNSLVGKNLEINYFENWFYLVGIFLIILFISLISGSYISVFVSSFSVEQIFKKRFYRQQRNIDFRKALVATQIIVFMILFSFSAIIIKQINYINNKDIGYDYKNLIRVIIPHNSYNTNNSAFMNEIIKSPSIEIASEIFAGIFSNVNMIYPFSNNQNPDEIIEVKMLQGDHNLIPTLKCKLVAGRNFNANLSSDTAAIILNETAITKLGLKSPINEILTDPLGNRFHIIGVIEDFNIYSTHRLIQPVGIFISKNKTQVRQILLRVSSNGNQQATEFLENIWKSYGPPVRLTYQFLEQTIETQYNNDKKFSDTIKILTVITILIGAFGIFGFSYYSSRQRIKEIGIRKVFGASIKEILKMLYRELVILITIAGLLAIPIAYIISSNWLKNYAYRIEFPYWIFILVFIAAITIVFTTTGITALNAANKNPVNSLKHE